MSTPVGDEELEVERLRARVSELESELAELQAWAYTTVAAAQEQTYWLDRWQLDLNQVMRRRSAARVRKLVRAARSVVRSVRRLKRQLQRRDVP